ncbi:hypothetical protein G5I_10061 [Acromyrmex echinatior]|uniref:Uncharacterized protein n=1 Tax=Acromyrmex echinatior TaxID=103372 RepID=F4WVV8_ACREC|nr:hypothetical protein G5I_10061 [Acromyrmex echinatior]
MCRKKACHTPQQGLTPRTHVPNSCLETIKSFNVHKYKKKYFKHKLYGFEEDIRWIISLILNNCLKTLNRCLDTEPKTLRYMRVLSRCSDRQYAEYRALYSGHGNDGPLSPGNDRYDPEHHQAVHRIVHIVEETHKTVRPINVRQLWTLKRHDKRMHCFCEFFRDGKLVHGRPVLKWAMFRITVGSIQRTVVFYTHSGPTGRMFYPRSTVESETDKSLKPGPVGVTLRVIREHNLNASREDVKRPSLLHKNEFRIVEKLYRLTILNKAVVCLCTWLKVNTRRLPHEQKHAGQRPERGHADSRCNSSETKKARHGYRSGVDNYRWDRSCVRPEKSWPAEQRDKPACAQHRLLHRRLSLQQQQPADVGMKTSWLLAYVRGRGISVGNLLVELARPLVLSRAVVCRLSASGTNTCVCTHTHRHIPSHVAVHVNIHLSFPHVHDQDSLAMDPEADEKMEEKNMQTLINIIPSRTASHDNVEMTLK